MKKVGMIVLSMSLMFAMLCESVFATSISGWHTADGAYYTQASTFTYSQYNGMTVKISKIAKDGQHTDYSGYTKAKLKLFAGSSKAYWTYVNNQGNTTQQSQTALKTCTKGTTYSFVMTDANGNPGYSTNITTHYKGNSVALNAEVYSIETSY